MLKTNAGRRPLAILQCSIYILHFAFFIASIASAQAPERYKARLTTVPMDGGMRSTVSGSGAATVSLAGSMLSITGTFDGLKSPATGATLHSGRAKGVRGASVADLVVSKSVRGSLSGTVSLTPDQVKELRDGRLYIEVASEKAPEGNLWGWILK
jgi:hypothetical protein